MTISAPDDNNISGEKPYPVAVFDPPPYVRKPDWQFIMSHPACFIAFGGGSGLSPVAPGTVGTLAAFPLFWFLGEYLNLFGLLLLVDVFFILGIWACAVTGRLLGAPDHGGMVWDEMVAFLLVLALVPDTPGWQIAAFLLFRVFDISKPQPIRYYEKKFRGGFGVMFDDILAAFFALLCLSMWKVLVFQANV